MRHLPIDKHIIIEDAKEPYRDKLSVDITSDIGIHEELLTLHPLRAFETIITNIKSDLPQWKYAYYKSNCIGQYARRIMRVTRDILSILSGNNMVGTWNRGKGILINLAYTECKQS